MKEFVKMTLAAILGCLIVGAVMTVIGFGIIGSIAALGSTQPVMPREGILTVDLSKVTWSSSNPEAVSVDENGMITAEKLGTAVITAKLDDSHTAACTVQVDDPEMLAPQYAEMRSRWTDRLTGNGSSITDDEDFQTSMESMAQDAEEAMENMADHIPGCRPWRQHTRRRTAGSITTKT